MGFWEDLDAQNQSDIQNLKAQKEERAAREAQEQADAEAEQAAAEAEANKSWLDRAEDETVNTARWVYNGLRSAAETVGEDVYGTAKNIVEAVSRLPEAYNRVLDTEQTITSAFTQENLAQAQETGDYSAQNEALAHAQENSTVVVDTAANLAGAFSRETRHIIGDQVDDAAEAGGWAPQSFRRSETFLEYFQSDEKKLQRAREIESVTGIPADSFLQDEEAYKEALGVYDYTKKMQNALGEQFSMDAVWQAYPELWDVAHMNTQDAALALHHMAEVRTTHGIVESFRSMLEFGNLQLEYNNLQYKIGNGTATDEDRKRAMELQEEMQKQKWQKELPSLFDEPVAVMAGSVASFVPMLAQQFQMAAEDAAPWMLSATWAGGAAGSVLPGVGTAAGAAAGGATGLARFGWLLVRNLAGVVESGSLAKTAAQVSGRVGFFEGMRRPMTGEKYHALGELTKEDGSPLLSREARWDYAQANGLVNAALGMTNLGMLGKALKGAPHATRITADVIARAQMNAGAVESMKAFARDRGMDVLKATATGAAVPGLMSVSDDVVHNQIAADTGETSIGVYSLHDMAVRGLQASVEMLPGALGFALVAGAGGTVTGGLGRAAALRHQAAFEARYGREAQRTMLGTAMFERLQQALKDSRLKQDAPEVTQQILRSQLKGTGFETVYIDTEMAAAKEHGMEDLRAVAKAAGLTDEELQQAVDQKGTITIAGEQFAQAASSPELLDAASFSPEAESMARMREGAKATLAAIQERSERTLREQEALQKGILDNYFPEDNTQETAEKRDALAAAMMQNPENPAEGWKQVRGEYRAQLDEILAPALAALKDGMGKGGLTMEVKDADGFTHTIRYSENSPWYKNFWAMNKRAPTAAELEDMAIALTTGDASAPKVEGWIVPDAETQAAMEQTRPIIEALQKNLAALDRVKGTVRSLNGVEMELTRGMSGEAFQVYKDLTRGLEKAPARAAQAARMGAVIFARHADIFARKMAEKTGAKYTALDYYRGRFGLDTVGEYRPGGAAYAQPVTEADLALDQQVPVLDLDTMDNALRGKSPKEVLDYIKQNLPKETIPTADFKAQVGIPEDKYGKAHLVWGRSSADAANRAARNATLTNLEAVIGHSYLVEVVPNTKTKPTDGMQGTQKKTQARKNRVDEFYRFIVPVKINGKMETLILVAENVHGNLKINEGETSLYEIYAAKKESRPYSQQESAQDSRIHATKGDSLSTVSIRDALRGVKDFLHQPYVDENGHATYGAYLKDGVMYFDEAQVERYRQMAGEGFSPAFVSWFGDSKIVNADGSPRVAYHGTATDGIRMFDTKKAQDKAGRQMGMGWGKGKFYFSFSEGAANAAASGAQYRGQGKHPQVMPVYLRVENPITAQAYAERYREISGGHELSPARYDDSYTIKDRDKFIAKLDKQLKKEGIDGILDEETGSVAVFDSRQVKSVENQGTFDASNPDIFYQQAWHGSPHVFDAFDLGAIGTGEGSQAHGWGLYFAKNREVSENYRSVLAGAPKTVTIDGESYHTEKAAVVGSRGERFEFGTRIHRVVQMINQYGSVSRTAKEMTSIANNEEFSEKNRNVARDVLAFLKEKEVKAEQDGTLLAVDVPENDVLLDENKTLDKQPETVQKALKALGVGEDATKLGQSMYWKLASRLGSEKAASEALNAHGVKGIRYDGAKDGECFVVFDDKAVKVIERYNQEANRGGRVNKGLITPLSDGRRIITLLEDADESTFVHEMGHLFLMDLADLAQVDEVSAKELALVDDWANWKQGAAKEYKNTPWAREFNTREKNIVAAEAAGDFDTADRLKREWRQERFARAFELYLREGKAPARGLRSVFSKFKEYLRFVYQAFTGDGGRASEPVRRVMDRMIATEEEIEAMRLDDRYRDVEAAGGEKLLTESERETYERWKKDAEEEAKTQLRKIVMQDLSARRQQEFDARVDRERERYQKELEQNPVVLAKRALDLSGDEAIVKEFGFEDMNALGEEAFKEENMAGGLSPMQDGWMEAALKEHMDAYAQELDKELIESYLTEEAAVKAMESSEYHAKLEGLVATALAKKMGLMNKITTKAQRAMMSIEDKLTALPEDVDMKMQKQSEPVKRLMKAINELRFSTRWSPADYASIERMVKAATKADVEAALKEIKTAAKEDKQNEKAVLEANVGRLETYRRVAAESIQKMELADATNVRRYRKQEQEAARRVRQMIQAKRWDMALRAQEQKAMAAEMAKQAKRMQSEVQKKLARVKKQLSARSVKLPRDERYWHRHLAYLLRIASTDAEKPEPRPVKDVDGKVVRVEEVQGLQELFKSMEDGLDTTEELSPFALVEKIASAGENFRGWQSLTRAEFDGAVDALTVLYTVGRDKFKMKTIGGKDIAEVLDEILADTSGDANYMKVERRKVEEDKGGFGYNGWLGRAPGIGHAVAKAGQEYLAVSMKPEEIIRALGKTAHKYLYGIYYKAITREAERLETAVKDLRGLRKVYTRAEVREWKRRKYAFETESGREMLSKENVLAMALNLGTKNNVQRLVAGFGAKEEAIRAFAQEHMTEKDWAFVQSVWDYLSSYWPETVATEEKLNGVTLKKEPAVPFTVKTTDGKIISMKGGYYPIKYAAEKSIKAANQEENRAAESALAGARVLGTGRSFTKGRADYVARPLRLELSVIPEHVQEVIHNIEVRIPARDVYRILYSKQMEERVTSTMGMEYYKVLTEWAMNVWGIMNGDANRASNKWNRFFGWLRRNSTMAIMGYRLWPVIENASNIGPIMDRIGAARGLAAVSDFYTHFNASRDLLYKSIFMRNRINSMDRDIRSQDGMFEADFRPFEIIRSHAYDMMLYSDLALSGPLWVATFKDSFGGLVGKVRAERDAAVQAVMEAQAKVDVAKGALVDAQVRAAEARERERAAAQRAAELADAAYDEQFVPKGSEEPLAQGEGSPFDVKRAGGVDGAAGAPEGAAEASRDGATLSTASRSPFPEGEGFGGEKRTGKSANAEESRANAEETTANAEEAPKSMKELQAELRAAEDAFQKAQEREILSDDEVVKEAERRAIAQADGAVRDTFGSGRPMDLSSMQNQKNEALKLMTVFYSFFNTQFNALLASYRHGKYSGRTEGSIRRWAPFARSLLYRVVVVSLIGSMLQYGLSLAGNSEQEKYRKVKNPETGKEEREEVPGTERFLKVFARNCLSMMTGGLVLGRDIANQAMNYALNGTTYGRGVNPMSNAWDAMGEAGKVVDLLARKGQKDLEIEEKHAKEAQEQAERLRKLKGKKRQEYLQKLEEEAKYKHPDERITYSEILRHAANAGSTLTASRTGLTNTLVDAITGTMQYLNDTDNRYDADWKNIVWSALFDKKPVEREIPQKPAAPPKKKKAQK